MARPSKKVEGLDPKKPSYEKHPEMKRNQKLSDRMKNSKGKMKEKKWLANAKTAHVAKRMISYLTSNPDKELAWL